MSTSARCSLLQSRPSAGTDDDRAEEADGDGHVERVRLANLDVLGDAGVLPRAVDESGPLGSERDAAPPHDAAGADVADEEPGEKRAAPANQILGRMLRQSGAVEGS